MVRPDPPWHAEQAEHVLRQEREVEADEHQPEMDLPEPLVEQPAEHLRPPVVDAAEDGEDGAAEEDIVEMRNDVVGVVHLPVDGEGRQEDAGQPAHREQGDEAEREQHRGLELDPAAPQGGEPVEDLHPGRDRDQHGGEREERVRERTQTDREHVVAPHPPAHEADEDPRVHHHRIAEQRLARERRQHLGDDAHRRQDEDVDLGMAEQPEEVLPEQRITPCAHVEEVRAEEPVEGEQHEGHCDHRHREQEQEVHDQGHPREHGHAHEAHPGRAHVDDGDDQVDGARERRDAEDLDAEDVEVDVVARGELVRAEGRVVEPAAVGRATQ